MKRTITLQQDYDEMDDERPRKLYLSNFLLGEEKKTYLKEAKSKWAEKNPEAAKRIRQKYWVKYYAKNKEKISAKNKARYKAKKATP